MDISRFRAIRFAVPLFLLYAAGDVAAQSFPYGHLGIELRRDVDHADAFKSDAQPPRAPRTAMRQRPSLARPPEEVPSQPLADPIPHAKVPPPSLTLQDPQFPADDWSDQGPHLELPATSLAVFAGLDAFKGPVDQGQNGNHGIHEGFNLGIPLSYVCKIGGQVGLRGTQSNFSGTSLSADERNQLFITTGIFRRRDCGFQWGAAFDWLDERYYLDMNLVQARGELGWVFERGGELGAMITSSSDDDEAELAMPDGDMQSNFWQPTEHFAIYYRRPLANCGEIRIWGGGTSDNDGILGGELLAPIADRCAIQVLANYKIPDDGTGTADGAGMHAGHVDEAWSLGVSLVWYPGRCASSETRNPFRPMFNVADNASFMVERQAR
jgi:hypothetical protein